MTDQPDLYERVALGRSAQELLHSETIKLAIDRLIARYENDWRNSAFGAVEIRELAYRHRAAVVDLKAELEKLAEDGAAAAQQIRQAEDDAAGKGPNV